MKKKTTAKKETSVLESLQLNHAAMTKAEKDYEKSLEKTAHELGKAYDKLKAKLDKVKSNKFDTTVKAKAAKIALKTKNSAANQKRVDTVNEKLNILKTEVQTLSETFNALKADLSEVTRAQKQFKGRAKVIAGFEKAQAKAEAKAAKNKQKKSSRKQSAGRYKKSVSDYNIASETDEAAVVIAPGTRKSAK